MSRASLCLALALAAPGIAYADRPATVALGLSASVETTPLNARALATLAEIDAGTSLAAPLWWHVTASFGAATIADDRGDGHLFALRTGPRLERCWAGTTCLGAGLDLGWGHARWAPHTASAAITLDGLDASASLHAAVAIDPRRKVFLAGTAGPTLHYALRTDDPAHQAMGDRTQLAVTVGLALVVRN